MRYLKNSLRVLILCSFFLFIFLRICPYLKAEEPSPHLSSRQDLEKRKLSSLNHPLLIKTIEPDRVMEIIRPKLKSGSAILDIGAGTGTFTFRFAEELKGKGEVFATDTDPLMIERIKDRIQKGKYKNVFAVLVTPDGLDPFYKEHKFDCIFMCKVYPYLFDPEGYLKGLRPSLDKDGQLYIISQRIDPDITEDQLDDFKKIIKLLADKKESYPFLQRLGSDIEDFVRNKRGSEVSQEMKERIIASFNKMLSDPSLYKDLQSYYHRKGRVKKLWEEHLNPRDYSFASWLVILLDKNRAFEKGTILSDADQKNLRMLNRLLILGTFGREPVLLLHERGINIFPDKTSIITAAEKAGFRLVREYDFLPKNYFLEFATAEEGRAP